MIIDSNTNDIRLLNELIFPSELLVIDYAVGRVITHSNTNGIRLSNKVIFPSTGHIL